MQAILVLALTFGGNFKAHAGFLDLRIKEKTPVSKKNKPDRWGNGSRGQQRRDWSGDMDVFRHPQSRTNCQCVTFGSEVSPEEKLLCWRLSSQLSSVQRWGP